MNELQRQAYLLALGIENYMPRMLLPLAPPPIQCAIPVVEKREELSSVESVKIESVKINAPTRDEVLANGVASAAGDILAEVKPAQKAAVSINAASILEQLTTAKAPAITPFALSLWRPQPGFLIIDSRNTGLALPTELLLSNLLRVYLHPDVPDLREDVMRWPMVENRFVSRTEEDARTELQTWLAVENELRPIQRLWLMGNNAARYLLPSETVLDDVYWQEQPLAVSGSLAATIFPSLIELLQNPLLKARFWATIH